MVEVRVPVSVERAGSPVMVEVGERNTIIEIGGIEKEPG